MKITKIALLLLSIMPVSHGSSSNSGDNTRNQVALYTVALVATFGAGWLLGKMCQPKPTQPSMPAQTRGGVRDEGLIRTRPHPHGTITALSPGTWCWDSDIRIAALREKDYWFGASEKEAPFNVDIIDDRDRRALSRHVTSNIYAKVRDNGPVTIGYTVTKGRATARIIGLRRLPSVTTKWSLLQTPRVVIFYDHEIGKLNIIQLQIGASPQLYLEAEDNIADCLESPYLDCDGQLVLGVVKPNTSFAHTKEITYTLHVPDPRDITVYTGHEHMKGNFAG
jgi:hypothetical protein